MTFSELPATIPEMRLWRAFDGWRSYVISCDLRHPHLGYRASWSDDGKPRHLPNPFPSFASAKRALRRAIEPN